MICILGRQTACYISPANTGASTTVRSPATAMARLLIAPSISPISIALTVPTAWDDAPIAIQIGRASCRERV